MPALAVASRGAPAGSLGSDSGLACRWTAGVEAAQEHMSGGEVLDMQVKRLPSGKDRNTGELIVESMYYVGGAKL